jgi:hypothetical protein
MTGRNRRVMASLDPPKCGHDKEKQAISLAPFAARLEWLLTASSGNNVFGMEDGTISILGLVFGGASTIRRKALKPRTYGHSGRRPAFNLASKNSRCSAAPQPCPVGPRQSARACRIGTGSPRGEPASVVHGLDMVAVVPSNFVSEILNCSL